MWRRWARDRRMPARLLATNVVVDAAGDLYIGGNGLVRRVDATTGVITTVAGDPAHLFGPGDIVFAPAVSVMAIDSAGRLLYLDGTDGSRVQRITLARDP